VTIGKFDPISNLRLLSDAAQLHTMVAEVEGVGRVAALIAVNPDANWHDRFASLLSSLAYAISRDVFLTLFLCATLAKMSMG